MAFPFFQFDSSYFKTALALMLHPTLSVYYFYWKYEILVPNHKWQGEREFTQFPIAYNQH